MRLGAQGGLRQDLENAERLKRPVIAGNLVVVGDSVGDVLAFAPKP
jgi:hypothetical protein